MILANGAEARLVASLQRGDEKAIEEVLHTHAGWMLGLARRLTNSHADAADCVQESFEILIKKINGFESRSSLKTWLHRVVVNQSLMKIRKRSSLSEETLEDFSPEFDEYGFLLGPIRITTESVEELASNEEVSEKVRTSIEELPDTYRVILLLCDIEGFTASETAALLGVEDNAVRTRLHRARRALRKSFESTLGATYLEDLLG